jgi:hypothetical protein
MYQSYFEDDYVGSKEINHPELAHLLYDYLPLNDEHNKQRQKMWDLNVSGLPGIVGSGFKLHCWGCVL